MDRPQCQTEGCTNQARKRYRDGKVSYLRFCAKHIAIRYGSPKRKRSPSYARHKTKYTRSYRAKIKQKATEYLGGKCMGKNCPLPTGYQIPAVVFDFHHRDPDQKDVQVTKLLLHGIQRWDLIKVELDKCDLLCCVCHRLIHYARRDLA